MSVTVGMPPRDANEHLVSPSSALVLNHISFSLSYPSF